MEYGTTHTDICLRPRYAMSGTETGNDATGDPLLGWDTDQFPMDVKKVQFEILYTFCFSKCFCVMLLLCWLCYAMVRGNNVRLLASAYARAMRCITTWCSDVYLSKRYATPALDSEIRYHGGLSGIVLPDHDARF
eukprot:1168056-Rhodomonas_salina.2